MMNDSDHCDCVVTQTSVQTCPLCLPVGSITHMIEDGRQLELLEEEGVSTGVSGPESYDTSYEQDPSETLEEVRLLDPSF